MKTILAALIALSLVAGVAAPVAAGGKPNIGSGVGSGGGLEDDDF